MGTLKNIVGQIRLRIKEDDVQYFSDESLIDLINGQMQYFYSLMQNRDCKFIADSISLDLSVQTEFLLTHNGIVWERVFTETQTVPSYTIENSDDFSYLETSTGIDFYNSNDETVYVYYWKSMPQYTIDDYNNDVVTSWPEWDTALYRSVVVEAQEIREHDNHRTAILAEEAVSQVLSNCIQRYGTFSRIMRTSNV